MCQERNAHTHTYLPLKELKGGPLLYRIVYIQAVVVSKYQADIWKCLHLMKFDIRSFTIFRSMLSMNCLAA